ncbi:MAG TPA: adenosylmethionine--8-amino-7-oxononanoate transaminase [Opitutaceae bacterium]|jgi:adenosylmethionine-8-amino-7-oxononanoate aminotransferase|nr:adenosylmethionine--8-amino-7-oxononanoate transaminase [Opitutaceae bacterium]
MPAADTATATDAVIEADRRHVWHPFTQMREYGETPPLAIASGRGGWLTDTEGRRYLDGNASIWTNVHGHNDPDLNAALRGQLDRLAHSTMLGLTHAPGAELAAELAALAPAGLDRVFFSDNGAGSVEVALKLSFQYWQLAGRPEKRGVIGLAGGYHGDTFGAMAAGDSGFFHDRFRPWCFPSRHFAAPECREANGRTRSASMDGSLAELRTLLAAEATRTACLILEPSVQGAAGMRLQPAGFVPAVAELCRQHEVHLILDEVFVGFGRLGPMLIAAEERVQPDFLCLAKGLTAGYLPLAATLARGEIFEAFLGSPESGRAFYHGHTFTGNPLAAAVALENIRKLRPLIAAGTLRRRIGAFGAALEAAFAGRRGVTELRQRGFAAAVDLEPGLAKPACLRARAHGLLLRPLGDSLLFVPPLCLADDELGELAARAARALDDVLSRP